MARRECKTTLVRRGMEKTRTSYKTAVWPPVGFIKGDKSMLTRPLLFRLINGPPARETNGNNRDSGLRLMVDPARCTHGTIKSGSCWRADRRDQFFQKDSARTRLNIFGGPNAKNYRT